MASSCSFRITRTAEDLAQTINSLSQRVVKLEERLQIMESYLNQDQEQIPEEEIKILDGVDQLLAECQELLQSSDNNNCDDFDESPFDDESDALAA